MNLLKNVTIFIFIISISILISISIFACGCNSKKTEPFMKIPSVTLKDITDLEINWKKNIKKLSDPDVKRVFRSEVNQSSGSEFCDYKGSSWPSFQGDIGNTGYSDMVYSGTTIEKAWEFDLGDHTWEYTSEMASWSLSPVYAEFETKKMLFTGCHDRNFYAIDAKTGSLVWQRPLGGLSMSAPLFTMITSADPKGSKFLRPVVIAACSDRSIYCLDAFNGEIIWSRELAKWSETVEPSVTGSPLIVKIGGKSLVAFTFFHSDKAFLKSVQQGMIVLLNPDTGMVVKGRVISKSPLSSPCVGVIEDKAVLYTADRAGCIYALTLPDLRLLWKKVLMGRIFSSPSFYNTLKEPIVSIADMYGMISLFNGITGEPVWSVKTGFFVNTTPAVSGDKVFRLLGNERENIYVSHPRIYVGSFDRMIHAYDVDEKKKLFSFSTQKYVSSNFFNCFINKRDAIVFASLDRNLYIIDAITGKELFRHSTSDMLWSFERPGQTVWSGPIPAGDLIVLPTPGNTIMAFRIK